MLIPYNTDAPLYHPPIATVATIVVNVLLFLPVFVHHDPYGSESEWRGDATEASDEDPGFDESDIPDVDDEGHPIDEAQRQAFLKQLENLQKLQTESASQTASGSGKSIWRLMTLEYGKFRPWQWLTANYMHAGLLHLIGNMFVLWGFGLVVEGKVGWWRFLLIYNAIGIIGLALVQFVMLFASDGFGLGASLAIFGILVVSLVWAPANEMQCIFMFGLRPIVFEASIMSIATGAVFLQLALSMLQVFTMTEMGLGVRVTGEIAHLIGGVLGLAVGIVMVKRNLVDCENWDMFSVWAGKNIRTTDEDRTDVAQKLEQIKKLEQKKLASRDDLFVSAPLVVDQSDELVTQFRSLVAAGKPVDAWTVFCRGQQQCFGWQVPEPDFVSYISALRKQQLWDHAVGAMQEYLQRYTERETNVRLALAQIFVQQLNRPRDAWKVLSEINGALLNSNEKAAYDKLRLACKQMVAASKNAPRPSSP